MITMIDILSLQQVRTESFSAQLHTAGRPKSVKVAMTVEWGVEGSAVTFLTDFAIGLHNHVDDGDRSPDESELGDIHGKIALIYSAEGGEVIEGDRDAMSEFARRRVTSDVLPFIRELAANCAS